MECSEHLKECNFNYLKEALVEKEMLQDQIFKLNQSLTEANQKLNALITSNKANEKALNERLGKFAKN